MVLPIGHLASKNTFSESASDLVSEFGNRRGSIAALVLHEDHHGPTGNAFVAVDEDNGEGWQSAEPVAESGRGVGGGYDCAHTFRGVCFCLWHGIPFCCWTLRRVGTGRRRLTITDAVSARKTSQRGLKTAF